MQEQRLDLSLLTALCEEWLAHSTPLEIGNDTAKIRLLKRFASEVQLPASAIPEPIRQLYAEVFLRSYDQLRAEGVA